METQATLSEEMLQYLAQKDYQFKNLQTIYQQRKKSDRQTGVKAVLQYLIDEYKNGRIWIWSYDFIGKTNSKGDFLSHRSPARASDLAIKHPELVEDRSIGNLKVYRLRIENRDKIINFLKQK